MVYRENTQHHPYHKVNRLNHPSTPSKGVEKHLGVFSSEEVITNYISLFSFYNTKKVQRVVYSFYPRLLLHFYWSWDSIVCVWTV